MIKFTGIAHSTAMFLQKEQLSDPALWAKFVDIYRSRPDAANKGWRGEYWGKMMRGACLIYEYTQDDDLYSILTDSVKDMMTVADPDGRVSSFPRDNEFIAWDLWCRKYVILACEYYLDICRDESLKKDVIAFISRAADYIITRIGNGEGQKNINKASSSWFGLNSSSILEPIVKLYKLTGEQKYLDFAKYIVDEGGALGINVFELAYENRLYPYQYGVSKAYEMTSCFEGLLEYYYVTGIEKYKIAVVNFAKAVLESEMSIIGSSGITHELFDHTRTRQTVVQDDVMQETCVTVTIMKFFSRVLELTGDSAFADAIERSFYNAYVGALNTEHKESPYMFKKISDGSIISSYLAFDSYSPLTAGLRGQKVGGNQRLPDNTYYGCCACIGAAGAGIFLKNAVTSDKDSITVNFFEAGTADTVIGGVKVTLNIETGYPVDGNIKINVKAEEPVRFTLKVRIPEWADAPTGYALYDKEWSDNTVVLDLPMTLKFHYPETWEEDVVYTDMAAGIAAFGYYTAAAKTVYHKPEEDDYIAVTRGPLTLAADSRTGRPADSVFDIEGEATLVKNEIVTGVPCTLKLEFTDKNGEKFYLVDYASAGRDWKTKIAAWLRTK